MPAFHSCTCRLVERAINEVIMYNVAYFKASGQQEVMDFMQAHPFITLCGASIEGRPIATHVPVLFEERGDKLFLLAHIMRMQGHTEVFKQNNRVLAIFTGPHTYVSASWYEDKAVASTWNYQAVHVSGILQFTDEASLLKLLGALTEKFENNPDSPALLDKMPSEYVAKMVQAIISFEIEITGIDHVFKLSQNRDAKSYEHIIRHLQSGDSSAQTIAQEMERKIDSNRKME